MKENEIRPQSLVKRQKQVFLEDAKMLANKKNEFIDVACPACGSNGSEPVFQKQGFGYVSCKNCETIYINPRPTKEILAQYYANSKNYEFWNKFIFPASEKVRKEKIFSPRAARVIEACKECGVNTNFLLEVGSGFGTFCEEVKRHGLFKRIAGVEPTPDLAETCRKKGIEVFEMPIEEVSLENGSVNVIAAFEVIEHLFSPEEFLTKCRNLLAPGGIVIITCPNAKGLDISVLKENSDAVDHEHLNYFNVESIASLLKKCGFGIIKAATPGELDAEIVRKKALAGEFDIKKQPFLNSVLIEHWEELGGAFQEFLKQNKLSSHMQIIARKA